MIFNTGTRRKAAESIATTPMKKNNGNNRAKHGRAIGMLSIFAAALLGASIGGGIASVSAQTDLPSDMPSDMPSSTPTADPGCSICGLVLVIGNPDAQITDPILGDTVTCAELQERAYQDYYTKLQCKIVQISSYEPCECTEPSTAPPTPYTSLATVTGSVSMVLNNVAAEMTDETIADYEAQTTAFLNEWLPTDATYYVSKTALIDQELLSRRRRLAEGRHLQEDLRPLKTTVYITGVGSEVPDAATFSEIMSATINDNTEAYISFLKASASPISQVYFKPVTAVEAESAPLPSPTAAPVPTDAPTEAPATSEGLSSQAKGGIAAGVVIGVLFIVTAGIAAYRENWCAGDSTSRAGSGGPSSAAARAAAAAGAGATAGAAAASSSSVKKSKTAGVGKAAEETPPPAGASEDAASASLVGDENMSYAYSVEAGNVSDAGKGGAAAAAASAEGGEEDSATKDTKKYTRTVVAPAGKLGIVIDTTLEGPVVHKINPTSPLQGILYPGDIIVKIGDTDTRAMSASSITALMVKTAGEERTLTVLSNDPNR